jgi:uncharacterized membrane protein
MKTEKTVILLGAALFISLSANLFMGGLMLGHSFTPRQMAQRGDDGKDHPNWKKRDEELRARLAPADRKILKETMQANRAAFMALRQKLTAAQQAVETAMNAKPFDRAALADAMNDEQAAKMKVLDKMRSVRDALADKVSPEARTILFTSGPFGHIDASRLDARKDKDKDRGAPPRRDRPPHEGRDGRPQGHDRFMNRAPVPPQPEAAVPSGSGGDDMATPAQEGAPPPPPEETAP